MDNFREQMLVGYFSFGNLLNLILVIKYLVILHNRVNASFLSLQVLSFWHVAQHVVPNHPFHISVRWTGLPLKPVHTDIQKHRRRRDGKGQGWVVGHSHRFSSSGFVSHANSTRTAAPSAAWWKYRLSCNLNKSFNRRAVWFNRLWKSLCTRNALYRCSRLTHDKRNASTHTDGRIC